jgi:uroporphyrinogen III methyltransferase/synthase
MPEGKVYLVGAGPGDPALITVRGQRLLFQCDAVVYDRLVPLELVVTLPRRVERHYAGKCAGLHSRPQHEINELLAQLAHQGKAVVRLKGGDPFVFGRGGEEAQYLREKGISFEIVPGITAGIAAPAYAGIPITFRGKSVCAIFLTAHEAADKEELQAPLDWLAQSRHSTIVGYMGVNQLPQVVAVLLKGSMSPATPAAIIMRGSTGVQKAISGKLADLPQLARESRIEPPAVFVIGTVAQFASTLKWFETGALFGKKIMVTRPADQANEMYALLRSQGAEVLPLPTIATEIFDDARGWSDFKTLLRDSRSNQHLWLVFTSENGVRYFLQLLLSQSYDLRAIGSFRIAAVGSGTAKELAGRGIRADFIPTRATTAALAEELAALIADQSCTVIRVQGNLGDERVERTLASAGARVIPLPVYKTFTAEWDEGMWALLEELPPDIIVFTSGSTVSAFVEILGADRALKLARQAQIASIGPSTTRIAKDLGLRVDIEATQHSIPGLVEAIVLHSSLPG